MSGVLKGRVTGIVTHRYFPPALALILGLALVSGRSLALDEAYTWGIVAQPDAGGFWSGLKYVSGNMAIYFAVLRTWAVVDDGVAWLRLPSVLFTVGTVAMVRTIGHRWFDRRTAVIASILAATSVPLLYYSLEIRSYAFVALMATFQWFFVERALRTDRWRDWIAFGVSAGLAVSGHVIMALSLPAIVAFVLISRRDHLVEALTRLVPLGLAVLPSVALVLIGDGPKTDWIPALGPVSLARAGRLLLGDHAQFTRDGSGFAIAALYALLYVLAAVAALRSPDRLARAEVLLWMWFLTLPATIVVVSLADPLLWHRYLIGALPAGILIVAKLLASVERQQVAVAVVAALAFLGIARSVALRPHSADEYEAIARLIEARAEPSDAIVMQPEWARPGLDYYWRDRPPVIGRPEIGPAFEFGTDVEDVDWVADGARIWLVQRSDSSQVWVETARDDDDFDEERLAEQLPSGYSVADQFDVQRFRIWLFTPVG